jgi:chaperonin GroES
MKIRPLQDRVVVKRVEEGEAREGEMKLPDSPQEDPQQGEVVEVGERIELGVKVGDRVLFGKYSGSELKEAGADYLVLKESEILEVLGSEGQNDSVIQGPGGNGFGGSNDPRGVTDLPGGTGTDVD